MTVEPPRVRVVGIGNAFRSDDAVGLEVARRMQPLVPPDVEVITCGGEATEILEALRPARTVYLVDAARSGRAPGTVHRFDALEAPLPHIFGATSTHSTGIPEAVELARVLDTLPERLVVCGIEGLNFGFGTSITAEVSEAIDGLATQLVAELRLPQEVPCTKPDS